MADYPKSPRVPEDKKCTDGYSKSSDRQRKLAEGLEQQNAIYREVFAKANIRYPEMKALGNYRIPKKSSTATTGSFAWVDEEDGKGAKVKWVEEQAPEKYVQKSILGLPYPEVEAYEQERLNGGYNRRPRPPPPSEPEPSTSAAPEPSTSAAPCWAPWRMDARPKNLNASVGSIRKEPSLAAPRAAAPVRPRHRFQSERNGDFDRGDYATMIGTMKTIASDVEERRSPVTEICPLLASGRNSSGGAAGGDQEGSRNSENMVTGESRQD